MVFAPQSVELLDKAKLIGTYYEPYGDEILNNAQDLKALPHKRITVKSFDGITLSADYFENEGSSHTVVFFHGYRSEPYFSFARQAKALYASGFSIALVYERAQNGFEGKNIGLGLLEYRDVISWCEYLQKDKKLVLYGSSMGCTAIEYALASLSSEHISCAVLDCGFVSVKRQIVRDSKRRKLPVGMLLPYIYLTLKLKVGININESVYGSLSKTDIPCLFTHGENDSSVPESDTKENYASVRCEKEIITVKNAEHTLSFIAGGETVRNNILYFIKKHTEVKP